MKLLFILSVTAYTLHLTPYTCLAQPPGFKSIHQLQSEEHAISLSTAPLVNPVVPLTPSSTDHFVFAVIGDNRPGHGTVQPAVYQQIIADINKSSACFVVNSGDLIFGSANPEETEKQFKEFVRVTQRLNCPVYTVVGNHEVWGRKENQQLYQQLICPELWYSFDYNFCHSIFLDSEVPKEEGLIDGEQLEWLEEDLANIPKKTNHIFVFLHRPLFSCGPHRGSCMDRFSSLRDELMELFITYGVDAIFCGHEHLYHKSVHEGIAQYISGGAGANLHKNFKGVKNYPGAFYHYLIVKVFPKKYEVEIRTPEGYPKCTLDGKRIDLEKEEE